VKAGVGEAEENLYHPTRHSLLAFGVNISPASFVTAVLGWEPKQHRVLTEEKQYEIGAGLEHSRRISLESLAQITSIEREKHYSITETTA
jgi:hypothetical protein